MVVVGAALFVAGRLLAARRVAPAALAGGWELPGGKVDPGETDEDALVRELHEELGVRARLLDRVPGEWRLGDTAVLRVWTAVLVHGEPDPVPLEDHDALRWLGLDELDEVAWLDADRPAVDAVRRHARELFTASG